MIVLLLVLVSSGISIFRDELIMQIIIDCDSV